MLSLIYDPESMTPAQARDTADDLGIGTIASGIPPRYASAVGTIPAAGYVVARETWQGIDVLPGPVTRQDIDNLPDPGPDPAESVRAAMAALKAAMAGGGSVDPTVVVSAIARLDDIIATGSVPALGPSPTQADVVAQVRLLTTAVNLEADAIRDLARIVRGMLRLLA